MAKKQTRRSISVSRTTYERLKAFCEANNISMSQFVETRVNDFLGEGDVAAELRCRRHAACPRCRPAVRPQRRVDAPPSAPRSAAPSSSQATSSARPQERPPLAPRARRSR